MRDTLNLPLLVKQGEINQRRTQRTRWTGWGLLLLLFFTLALPLGIPSQSPGDLYILTDNQWERAPIAGAPLDIQVSVSGAVWVNTTRPTFLHRYEDDEWTTFGRNELGSGEVMQFALDGDEVWAAVGTGVAYFAGSTWTVFPNVRDRYSYVTGIVVGDYGVMLVDYLGNVTTFHEGIWQTEPLQAALPNYRYPGDDFPYLQQAFDGSAWLAFNGLWNFDGKWHYYGDSYGEMIAADEQHIYFGLERGLATYNFLAEEWVTNPFGGTNINTRVHDLTKVGDLLWVAVESNVLLFDGQEWRGLSVPIKQPQYGVYAVAGSNDGKLWAVAHDERVFDPAFNNGFSPVPFLLSFFGLLVSIISVFILWLRMNRSTIQRIRLGRQLLSGLVPDLSHRTPINWGVWRIGLYYVAGFAGGFLLPFVTLFIEDSPLGIVLLLLLYLVVWIISPMLFKLRDPAITPSGRAYLLRNIRITALLVGFVGFVAIPLEIFFIVLVSVISGGLGIIPGLLGAIVGFGFTILLF